ncbi:peroxisomal membrane protein pex14 [Chamberlinius hualienensis]
MEMDTNNNEEKSTAEGEIQSDTPNNLSLQKELPREHLIDTAVKFLTNPKVSSSSLDQKRTFLQKKGLTTVEIDESVRRAGATVATNSPALPPNYNYSPPQPYGYYPPPVPVSNWSKFRDIWYMAVIIGGTVCAAYVIAKKYIIPYFLGLPKKEDRLSKLETRMSDFQTHLDESIAQLQKTVEELQNNVKEACLKHETVSQIENAAQTKQNWDLTDMRSEITSLKGLLLNRHQFPAVPNVAPIIPSWQLEKQNTQGDNVDDLKGCENGESEA